MLKLLKPLQVLVLIHGGGFRSGSKNLNNYINLSNFFACRGLSGNWQLNYKLGFQE